MALGHWPTKPCVTFLRTGAGPWAGAAAHTRAVHARSVTRIWHFCISHNNSPWTQRSRHHGNISYMTQMRLEGHVSPPQFGESSLTEEGSFKQHLAEQACCKQLPLCETWSSCQRCGGKTWPHYSTAQIIHSWIKWELTSVSPWRLSKPFPHSADAEAFTKQGCENSVCKRDLRSRVGGCGYEHTAIPHRHRNGEEETNSISRTIYANGIYLHKLVKYLSQYFESYCCHFPPSASRHFLQMRAWGASLDISSPA